MVICLKRPKMILIAFIIVLVVSGTAVAFRHICCGNPAKAVSTVFEAQTTRDKMLVYLFSDRIQEQSNEFYAPYYTVYPTVAYYFTTVKEVKDNGVNIDITFTTLPYIGPHDTIGEDEITFRVNHSGKVTPIGLKHLKNDSLPDYLSNVVKGQLPPITFQGAA